MHHFIQRCLFFKDVMYKLKQSLQKDKTKKNKKNAHLNVDLCNIYTNDLVHKHHSPSKYLTSKVGYVGRAKETILLIKFLFIDLLSC